MDFLLKNGYLVLEDKIIKSNLLIKDGKMHLSFENTDDVKIIDISNLYVLPGLIDMHVHLRDPGQTYKEDIKSGTDSAAVGGITSVAAMPNTCPVVDNVDTLNYILDKSKDKKANVYQVAAITKNLKGDELVDFNELKNAGAIAFSDDGLPVKDANTLLKAMEITKEIDSLIISHCEDLSIVDEGIINEGKVSKELNVKGIKKASEDSITAREIALAESEDLKVHIAHVSTKVSVGIIRDAKKRGVKVTCETCPHYFTFTEEELLKMDANFKMNPPLRTKEDKDAIIEGILDKTIDCIVTDHAPHADSEKRDFKISKNGVIGLETSLSATLSEFYHNKKLSLNDIVRLMSKNPAKILKIEGGEIKEGANADLAVVDIDKEYIYNREDIKSKSKNSPFIGKKLKGKNVLTIKGGKIVYNELDQ